MTKEERVEFMERVKRYIRENPDKFNQGDIAGDECVGGVMKRLLIWDGFKVDSLREAHRIVFGAYYWPWLFGVAFASIYPDTPYDRELCDRYRTAETVAQRVEIAVEAIDKYVKEMEGV